MEARTLSTPADMRELLYDVARRASEYRGGLAHRSIWPSEDALARLAAFDETLPREGTAPADVVAMLDDLARDATVASAGPRYLGFVIGGTFLAALAANWLATAWDQCAGYGGRVRHRFDHGEHHGDALCKTRGVLEIGLGRGAFSSCRGTEANSCGERGRTYQSRPGAGHDRHRYG